VFYILKRAARAPYFSVLGPGLPQLRALGTSSYATASSVNCLIKWKNFETDEATPAYTKHWTQPDSSNKCDAILRPAISMYRRPSYSQYYLSLPKLVGRGSIPLSLWSIPINIYLVTKTQEICDRSIVYAMLICF